MMNKKKWIIIGVIVLIVLWAVSWVAGFYNSMISLNEQVDGQWAQVDSQYQRRFDLVPNLVNSVKGSMKQEQAVFLAIAEARTRYSGAVTTDEKAAAATQVEGALGRLLVVMENYPNLKSIDTVQSLMTQLEGTENRISVERMRFNDMVKTYNVKVKRFPNNLLAGSFGFDVKNFFESTDGADQAPNVDLNVEL